MSFSSPATWFTSIASPLTSKFGADLTVSRSGNMVCWGYDGQSAVVELDPDGFLRAAYIDAERRDAVSDAPVAAVYRCGSPYALTESGCRRMIADLCDFFSGVREPAFTFVDDYSR
jgi:hypothetical protein